MFRYFSNLSDTKAGNQFFREAIIEGVEGYRSADTRFAKSLVVLEIINKIRFRGGRFLKQDTKNGQGWYELSEQQAKEKVGHAIRDASSTWDSRVRSRKQTVSSRDEEGSRFERKIFELAPPKTVSPNAQDQSFRPALSFNEQKGGVPLLPNLKDSHGFPVLVEPEPTSTFHVILDEALSRNKYNKKNAQLQFKPIQIVEKEQLPQNRRQVLQDLYRCRTRPDVSKCKQEGETNQADPFLEEINRLLGPASSETEELTEGLKESAWWL